MNKVIEIATLITCHNRRDKTVSCISDIIKAQDSYNATSGNNVNVVIYLTDDGCTDGTAEAIAAICKDVVELHIIKGSGSLYWAGGMRVAWNEALKNKDRWMFYLLLNDDTNVLENVFSELFSCHEYSLKTYGICGLYSGITSSCTDHSRVTYGGDVFTTRTKTLTKRLYPVGEPQIADIITANILLVPKEVVEKIGIFYEGFIHSGADNDYSVIARQHGIRSFVTSHFCGRCDYDHVYDEEECLKLINMTLSERRKYVNSPTRSDKDYLMLIKRTIPLKYPISVFVRAIRLYFPSMYYKICVMRGYYH